MSQEPTPPGQDLARDVLGDAPTLDEVVAALRDDPVLVHPLFGNGARDEVDAALTAKVAEAAEAGVPVYVALVPDVPGLAQGDYGSEAAEDLAVRLADRLGDGVYFAATDPHSLYPADAGTGAWEDVRLDWVPGQSDEDGSVTALVGGVAYGIDQLADNGEDPAQYLAGVWQKPEWQYDRDGSASDEFQATFVPTTALVLVTIVVALVVRTALTWRATAPTTPTGGSAAVRLRKDATSPESDAVPTLRSAVADEVAQVEDLRAARAGRRLDDAVRDRVDGSLAAARTLLDHAGRGHRREPDLVGALVLARIARRALEDPGAPAYRPCYVNPLHGEATDRRDVGAAGVEVPVCRACARGPLSHPFVVQRGLRREPYFARDDVWARTGYGALTDDLWTQVARARRAGGAS
ncbi:hypothetical protein RDV89_15675 [Nocardioides zeae]|uniref:DUF4350 domain-containing protein n=1 Tax=Nocardioides imazamoxiresistens TaxID=3231893 RepID=A0ABU3PZE9_9ACTN|nr:hypothetical protein [Nocardioides zeae]MDT9594524.1 hypothetical protein [Nocardioides zeae]